MPFNVNLLQAVAGNNFSNPVQDTLNSTQNFNKNLLNQLATNATTDFASQTNDPYARLAALNPTGAKAIAYGRMQAIMNNMNMAKQKAITDFQAAPTLANLKQRANVEGNTNLIAQLMGISTSGGVDAAIMNSETLGAMGAGEDPFAALNKGIEKSQLNRSEVKVNAAGQPTEFSGPAGLQIAGAVKGGQIPGVTNQGSISTVTGPVDNLMNTIGNMGVQNNAGEVNNLPVNTLNDPTIEGSEQFADTGDLQSALTPDASIPEASEQDLKIQELPKNSQDVLNAGPAPFDTKGQPLEIATKDQEAKVALGNEKKKALDSLYTANPDKIGILKQVGTALESGAVTNALQPIQNQVLNYAKALGVELDESEAANLDLDKLMKITEGSSVAQAAGDVGVRGVDTPAESNRYIAGGLRGSDAVSVTIKRMDEQFKKAYYQDMAKEYANIWEDKMGNLNAKSAKGQDFDEWFRDIAQKKIYGDKSKTLYNNPDYLNKMVENKVPIFGTQDQIIKMKDNIPDGALIYNTSTGNLLKLEGGKATTIKVK